MRYGLWEKSQETIATHQETPGLWRGGEGGVRQSRSARSQFQIKRDLSGRSEK